MGTQNFLLVIFFLRVINLNARTISIRHIMSCELKKKKKKRKKKKKKPSYEINFFFENSINYVYVYIVIPKSICQNTLLLFISPFRLEQLALVNVFHLAMGRDCRDPRDTG
jgi:heme/copper-type cytochrome/quinol oxidase subunit 4